MRDENDLDLDELLELKGFLKSEYLQARSYTRQLNDANPDTESLDVSQLKSIVKLRAINAAAAYLQAITTLEKAKKASRLQEIKSRKP